MSKTSIHTARVEFGDCDPAGIVFFPNFSCWMDAASHRFFRQCGLPPWRDPAELPGCVGGPLLEIHTRFLKSATYGETIEVHTDVEAWRPKAFIQRHRVTRGDELLCQGRETRALCVKLPNGRLKAVPIPDSIRRICS